MNPQQPLSDIVSWAGKNIVHNLKFVPEDKLNWKPTPDAKSTLEICGEVVDSLSRCKGALQTGAFTPVPDSVFSTREEASESIERICSEYVELLKSLNPADLEGDISTPFGPMSRTRIVLVPVIDAVHHHGQISYIQTMLGDTQSHFFEMGT